MSQTFEFKWAAQFLHFLQKGTLECLRIKHLLLSQSIPTSSLESFWSSLSIAYSPPDPMGDSSNSSLSILSYREEYEYLQIEMNHSISTMSGKTKLKVIFLGNQSVGKTCIIDKYINDRFEDTANPTVGIDFLAKNVIHNAKSYRLQLWDTAGQERFRSLIPGYLKDAHCALIVYDVTAKSSFADIEAWIKLYNENKAGEGFIFLVGNKIDREFREVSQEEGLEKANRLGLPYFQISAKTGEHIDDLFAGIIEQQTEKKITSSKFLQERPSMKPVEMVKQEKEEKEEEEVKPNVEDTGAKIVEEPAVAADNIVLKNEKKPEANPKKANCC